MNIKHLLFWTCICVPINIFSQTDTKINAGMNQFVNWENSHSANLKGYISSKKNEAQWSCPANRDVKFQDPSSLETQVTFPRPGYYQLILTEKNNTIIISSDSVIFNVYKPGSYSERLKDLVNLMTLEEKVKQLDNLTVAIPRLNLSSYNYWSEALHGVLDKGVTSFPQGIAMGSTWDPELVQKIATVVSDEARIKNITDGKGLTYWSPTVNIARDPRWGRNEESYSEDPYLLSKMGVAYVKGLQGDHPYYLKTVATPKHFVANNEEIRRHNGSSDVDMRSLWEYYMQAFKNTIIEGKAYSIMGAYNELNNVPCNANSYLLNDVLRRTWGFKGFVVSDCGAIHDMVAGHNFYNTGAEASAGGIIAGCDLNCGDYYSRFLIEAVNKGYVDERDIDTAVSRVLSSRFRLGEFDPDELVPYKSISKDKIDSKEHRDLALEAAQKAIVLLKNDGILPIDKNKIKRIAVIGPNAAECELGIYSGIPNFRVSPLDGITNKASENGIKVNYAKGSGIGGGFFLPIEAKYFSKVSGSDKTGMKGEYFNNRNLEGTPVITRIDSMIDFFWGGSPAPELKDDNFSVRWTGKIKAPVTRTFNIGTRSDDGARLYVDGKLLIDDWTEHGEKPNWAKIFLEEGKEYEIVFEYFESGMGAAARLTWDIEQPDYEPALEAAKNADLVVLCLGTNPGLSQEEYDRMDISLPAIQQDLLNKILPVNNNIVIVLINGGPVALSGAENKVRGIIEAWYTGQSSGTAIADVLFGDINPGGKLPETFYKSTSQLPPFFNYDLINFPRTYMYFTDTVLYPFGYGLSYTTFEYNNLSLNSKKINKSAEIKVSCKVKNIGKYKGDEVVQVYYKDIEASVKVPVKKLCGFQRITLDPGEEKMLSFSIPVSELSFYDIESNDFIVEPGEFEIQIGSSSQDIRLKERFIVE